jgi:hypothetical protein
MTLYLTSAQASVVGGGDAIVVSPGSGAALGLNATSGNWDTVSGSNMTLYLGGAQASVTGSSDTANFNDSDSLTLAGGSDTLAFQHGIGGADVIGGFVSNDVIQMSQTDFASFDALSHSGDLRQSGANTVVALDASDTITLLSVTASTLTSAQFNFV